MSVFDNMKLILHNNMEALWEKPNENFLIAIRVTKLKIAIILVTSFY